MKQYIVTPVIIIMIISVFIVACEPQVVIVTATPDPTGVVAATATNTPPAATDTRTPSEPSSTKTETPSPTLTPSPTYTITPSETFTASPTPTSTEEDTPTQELNEQITKYRATISSGVGSYLRACGSLTCRIITILPYKTKIEIDDFGDPTREWVQIIVIEVGAFQGMEGWVFREFTERSRE